MAATTDRIPPVDGADDLVLHLDGAVEGHRRGAHRPTVVLVGPGAPDLARGFRERLRALRPHPAGRSASRSRPAAPVNLVAHALVEGGIVEGGRDGDVALLDRVANQLARSMPARMGELDLPSYWMLRDLLAIPATGSEPRDRRHLGARLLDTIVEAGRQRRRDLRAARREGHDLLETLPRVADLAPDPAVQLGRSLTEVLAGPPRLVAKKRWERRLAWLPGHLTRRTRDVYGTVRDAVAAFWEEAQDPSAPLVREVLTLALLRDLDAATRRSLSPRRRRRRAAFVVILVGPEEQGGPPGRAPEHEEPLRRFVATVHELRPTLDRETTLVLAALSSPVPELTGEAAPTPLRDAGKVLPPLHQAHHGRHRHHGRGRRRDHRYAVGSARPPAAFAFDVPAVEPGREASTAWLDRKPHVEPLSSPWRDAGPLCATGLAGVLVLGLGGLWLLGGADGPCPGVFQPDGAGELVGLSDGTAACSFFPHASPEDPIEWGFRQAEESIAAENARVLDGEYGTTPHRTVVHFAPLTSPGMAETFSPGSLRELRSVALAQEAANREARRDHSKVPLVVRLANPGSRFRYGEEVARRIRDTARADDRIVGVSGISQSRTASRRAIGILEEAELPVVTGTVTADHMAGSSELYYQVAPNNDRIAAAMVEFAIRLPTVDGARDDPPPANRVVVVTDHSDEYSWNLAEGIIRHLTGAGHEVIETYSYPAEDQSQAPGPQQEVVVRDSPSELADSVCRAIDDPARDLVIYTARAQQLAGVLDGMSPTGSTRCPRYVTILAADDITDFFQDPSVSLGDYPFVRLYYTALAAPIPLQADNTVARRLIDAYVERYGEEDLVRDISGPALNYDAFLILQEAINQTSQAGFPEVTARDVAITLGTQDEVRFEGASGYINFTADGDTRHVPRDKPVVVLRADATGAVPLMLCGQFSRTVERTTWGPSQQFDCPRDDEG